MSDRTQSQFQRDQQAAQQTAAAEDTVKAVALVFDRDAGRYKNLLPSHVSLDDFRNAFLTSVQRNPRLLEADRSSFWLALQQAAGDGLKCDNREAALVIFSDTEDEDEDGAKKVATTKGKPKQVVYMPMTQGLRKLVRNTGLVSTIEVDLIFKGEVVKIWREDGKRHFEHVTNTEFDADRSDKNIIGAYAVVNFKDGTWQVEWMSRAEIEKVRAVSRAKSARSPWQAWYSEMAKKTPLRRLIKQLDKSPEIAALDKALENDPTLGETIDGEATEIAAAISARPTETQRRPTEARKEHPGANTTNTQGTSSTKTEPPEDPDDWRKNHGETTRDPGTQSGTTGTKVEDTKPNQQQAGSAGTTTKQEKAPVTSQPASNTPSGTQTGTILDQGGFEAWIVDADGVEIQIDPYSDAMQFAAALTTLCAGKPVEIVKTILENNEGAISDCRDASAPAGSIIDAIMDRFDAKVEQEPLADDGGATGDPVIEVLAIPQTPGGKPHWPNYTTAIKARFEQCRSAEEATAWMATNKPVYFGKCMIKTENDIQRLYDQTLARFGAPVDGDRDLAVRFMKELEDCRTNPDALKAIGERKDVTEALTRWKEERPELFDEIRAFSRELVRKLKEAG